MMQVTNSLIPLEEAIYYLEELLRDASGALDIRAPNAHAFFQWRYKVDQHLALIFGFESKEWFSFVHTEFGSKAGAQWRKEFIRDLQSTIATIRGYISEMKRAISLNQFSRDCFVAMWFDDSMEETYQVGIYSPLKKMGYNPIRIDKKAHNERIDRQIFDGIRKSRFVVSDITGHRGGVYYEAGFAAGLGLPVIQTCNESDFSKRHFDVFTINTIVYKTNEDLAEKLRQRVMETIG